MLVKAADGHDADIRDLEALLRLPGVAPETAKKIEAELRQVRAGDKAERDAAYEIEFHFGRSPNWATIHDLRIEHDGHVAQIDHLIIDRLVEIWVCESKHFAEGVSVNEHGEWSRWWQGRSEGIPSPVEQNRRHIVLLERVFEDHAVRLPKRLGLVPMKPDLRSLVLVSSNAKISRPKAKVKGLDEVIKADQIKTRIIDAYDAGPEWRLSRVVGKEGLVAFAGELAALHRPAKVDWAARFGIDRHPVEAPTPVTPPTPREEDLPSPPRAKPAGRASGHVCAACAKPISFAVVKFCWNNPKRFAGAIYCMDCQSQFR
ncbi:MAG TPA: nuclease-related domain-containing protein [Candidatus Limnocylindrales bacterium]